MPTLRCERFGPFDLEELKDELENLEFEYMMDLAPSKPPSTVRLCECKDEDYEGYHVRVFVGDYEYTVQEGYEAEEVKEVLLKIKYEVYAEQDLEGVPRFHNTYLAQPGKSPYDKHYIEECKKRADAYFKEKEDRKAIEAAERENAAAENLASSKPWSDTPESERNVAVIFPGQGTQKVGMGAKLLESKEAQAMFELGSKVLGYDLLALIAQGPQEKLDSTLYSQPSIFVTSLAAMEKAKRDAPDMLKKIKAAAGFSLGEYTALVFGGAMSFEEGLQLVKARAEAMDVAAKADKGAMCSVAGCTDDKLQQALDAAADAVGSGKKAWIANYMFPEGRTCSGDPEVLERLCELAPASYGAKNAKMLAVSGAFHTPLMAKASEALEKALDAAKISMPSITVYSNVTGKPYESVDQIRALLKRQLLEPVRWEQGTQASLAQVSHTHKSRSSLAQIFPHVSHPMFSHSSPPCLLQFDEQDLVTLGCATYVEPGPGKQLKAMMRRIDQDAWNKTVTLDQ